MVMNFQDIVPNQMTNTVVTRGSLISFFYQFHKPGHDPQPLVLVTDIGNYLRGLNLHYLTFPTIKKLLFPAQGKPVCDSPLMTYQYIKNDTYITSAFRQYKRNGIQNLKKLDCGFIVNALAMSRSFDPYEIEAIRKSVREQIQRIINPPAGPTSI